MSLVICHLLRLYSLSPIAYLSNLCPWYIPSLPASIAANVKVVKYC